MKSLMVLWKVVAEEFGDRCCACTTRDFEQVERRVKDEGLSFLTITLPNFGKDFERALSQGQVDPSLFVGFSRKESLPRFLGGFLDLIFSRKDGLLLENPDIEAISAIRQLTLMFGKINLDTSESRRKKAFRDYLECERDLKQSDASRESTDMAEFLHMCQLLYGDVLTKLDHMIEFEELHPRHGPGKTADKISGNQKFNQKVWPSRLERMFPAMDYILPNARYIDYLDEIQFPEPGAEIPVRVISVPKTQKTPRIIAIEPTAMQYMQQALMQPLVELLESDKLTQKFIGFTDQVPNQVLAKKGSHDGTLATLDLSEASDRVSNSLVRVLLSKHSYLFEAVDACRSRSAVVPGCESKIRLTKFASMGSALCFPMEAMVFTAVVFLGIQNVLNRRLTRKDIQSFSGRVRVYGDDIICPVEYARSVVDSLELFGFKVNANKSFLKGLFRESCGKEYYDGHDVSIVRVRRLIPTQRSNALGVISMVNLRNRFYFNGLWATARYLDAEIRKVVKYYPTVGPNSPVLGRISLLSYEVGKMDQKLHRPLVKGYVVRGTPPPDSLDGYGALLKFFLKTGDEPVPDRDHLERYGRPDAVSIKLGWHVAY